MEVQTQSVWGFPRESPAPVNGALPNVVPGFSWTPTAAERAAFLVKLAESARYTHAAAFAGVNHSDMVVYRNKHPEFQRACDYAIDHYKDGIEREVERRAIEGVISERVTKDGTVVTCVRKSDDLLKFFAKRHIKEYKDEVPQMLQINNQANINVNVEIDAIFASLTPGQIELARQLLTEAVIDAPAGIDSGTAAVPAI
jgi:hypothetical protein